VVEASIPTDAWEYPYENEIDMAEVERRRLAKEQARAEREKEKERARRRAAKEAYERERTASEVWGTGISVGGRKGGSMVGYDRVDRNPRVYYT
jgi:chemotaxis response regulator CheB